MFGGEKREERREKREERREKREERREKREEEEEEEEEERRGRGKRKREREREDRDVPCEDSKRLRVYVQDISVCTGNRPACVQHVGVLLVHTETS